MAIVALPTRGQGMEKAGFRLVATVIGVAASITIAGFFPKLTVIYFALASAFFVVTGWPMTEICLSLVAVLIGLSSTAPDTRTFTTVAILATPIACLLAGIPKYIVLDGVSELQLLAIVLAPVPVPCRWGIPSGP